MRLPLPLLLLLAVAPVARAEDYPFISGPGGDWSRGVLLNRTLGAAPCDPPDPCRPTLVVAHGLNTFPRLASAGLGETVARQVALRGGPYNVLVWDWNGDTIACPIPHVNQLHAADQGRKLAAALRRVGIDRARTTMVGHSLGTVVVTSAACCLAGDGGGGVAKLVLLEPVNGMYKMIFEELCATACAGCVENVYSPGVSGFGRPVDYPGVVNRRVTGPTPWRGLISMQHSNHVFVGREYAGTVGLVPTDPP